MAKDKIAKTNAARLLDRDKVKYELVPYEVDENDLSCVHVAATLGENIEQVFKTLVLQGDKSGYFVCVIPGEHEINRLFRQSDYVYAAVPAILLSHEDAYVPDQADSGCINCLFLLLSFVVLKPVCLVIGSV